jgi:cation:H+ antiporter
MTILLFASIAGVIVLAGTNLSRYGEALARGTGLGRTFIGFVLTATITSLPELVIGISSVAVHRAPEVAVGDVAGSLVFNLLLVVLIDLLRPPGTAPPDFRSGHGLLLGGGALGLVVVAAGLAWPRPMPGLGRIGATTPVLLVLYVVVLRRFVARRRGKEPSDGPEGRASLRKTAGLYAANAALVIGAAGVLPKLAVDLAVQTGYGQSFVGTMIVGATTSLPELAVTVAAVRLRAVDLAIAGLLGSNLFDLLILAIDDTVYAAGPLLGASSMAQIVPLLAALLMSAALAAGAARGAWPRRRPGLSAVSLLLAVLYVGQGVVLFLLRPRSV